MPQWPTDVERFLAQVDHIVTVPDVPTVAHVLRQGRLTLLLGSGYTKAPRAAQVEQLRHESSHIAHGHWARGQGRTAQVNGVSLMNLCTDAIIHLLGECDWELIDRLCNVESVTLDRLSAMSGLPLRPMPAEALYDYLLQAAKNGRGNMEYHGGCGSEEHSHADDSLRSKVKRLQVRDAIGCPQDGPMPGRLTPTAAPIPSWVQRVIDELVTLGEQREENPERSWVRLSRVDPVLLPGYRRAEAKAAHFLLDASGSINHDEVEQFFAAVCATPELAGSLCTVFSTEPLGTYSVQESVAIREAVAQAGGATNMHRAGRVRSQELQTVWLTDGYTTDTWPEHGERDLWVVCQGQPIPPGATVIWRD